MRRVCIVVIIIIFLTVYGYADRFMLKTGEVIEGELVSEDSEGITVKVRYGTVKIDKSQLVPTKVKSSKEGKIPKIIEIPFTIPILPLKWINEVTSPKLVQGMHRWLLSQQNQKTGIVESYRPTVDVYLEKQAATYDQALAGLAFLVLGDKERAKDILEFYKEKWDGSGFSNFYFTPTGNSGIESTVHLGPNIWIALLALHYDRVTGKDKYVDLAKTIVEWAIKLPHYRGGVAMSNRDEWRAPWTKVVSTENNIDYYAVLSILLKRARDPKLRKLFEKERFGVIDFLSKTVYDKKTGAVYRGYHEGVVDRECALDTITWLIAAVGIEELKRWGISTEKLIDFAERKFLVEDKGIKGFDFTDKKGAFKAKRARMISIEWTLGMVNAYCIYSNYCYGLAKKNKQFKGTNRIRKLYQKACIYEHKARFYLLEMDKKLLKFGPKKTLYAYPYATRSYWLVFYDSPWWKTPKAGASGVPAGSVASTTWRVFATRFNPLNAEGEL